MVTQKQEMDKKLEYLRKHKAIKTTAFKKEKPEKTTAAIIEIPDTIDILQTWGTGSLRRTMSLNIKKRLYSQIGWKIGDFLKVTLDVENKQMIISKVEITDVKVDK